MGDAPAQVVCNPPCRAAQAPQQAGELLELGGVRMWDRTCVRSRKLPKRGSLEAAASIAAHASTRTTQLYNRNPERIALSEIERIRI